MIKMKPFFLRIVTNTATVSNIMSQSLRTSEAAKSLAHLAEAQYYHTAVLKRYGENRDQIHSDVKNDSKYPIYDAFYESNGSETIVGMENFTPQ